MVADIHGLHIGDVVRPSNDVELELEHTGSPNIAW